jgi:hypothetical protein
MAIDAMLSVIMLAVINAEHSNYFYHAECH